MAFTLKGLNFSFSLSNIIVNIILIAPIYIFQGPKSVAQISSVVTVGNVLVFTKSAMAEMNVRTALMNLLAVGHDSNDVYCLVL